MSLSRIAVEQREKEAQALNFFLVFSLIGSLALHIGVLSLGLGKFLSKAPELENEPIEIAIVELPSPQKLELKQENEARGFVAGKSRAILSNSGSSKELGVASGASQEKSPIKIAPSNSSVATSEILKVQPAPQQKLSQRSPNRISPPQQNQETKLEEVQAKIVTQPKPVVTPSQFAPSEIVTQPKPVVTPSPVPAASVKPLPEATNPLSGDRSSQVQQSNNQKLNSLLVNAKNAREQASKVTNSGGISDRQAKIAANLRNKAGSGVGTSNGLGNSAGNELRNGTGKGNGNGTSPNNSSNGNGTGTGNSGTGRGNNVQSGSTVATGTRNIERRTLPEESNSNYTNPSSSSSGRLAYRTCSKPEYPEKARQRGLEGKAEISVDVDSKGNVTNVRLAQTSGHAELDKAAVEQARNWKFNAPNGAAQGVSAKVDFAIEGSVRSRQIRERRRKRGIRKQPVASSQNTQTQPSTQTTNITRTPQRQNTNTALRKSLRRQSATVRRRVDTLPPRQRQDRPQRRQQTTLRSPSQTRLRESLKRLPRATSPNQTRRRRQQPQTTSPNQSRLRQSLRLHQQKSQSTPSSTNSNEQ